MYDLLDRYLDIDKDISSMICLLEKLEESFSEEENKGEKFMVNSMLLMLDAVDRKLKKALTETDKYILQNTWRIE